MKISSERIRDVIKICREFRVELERLHYLGEGKNGCLGWPECDCRLAEQVRGIVHIEDEWKYRAKIASMGRAAGTTEERGTDPK